MFREFDIFQFTNQCTGNLYRAYLRGHFFSLFVT